MTSVRASVERGMAEMSSSYIANETTVTRRELIGAIERNPEYKVGAYAFDQVDSLLRDIIRNRTRKSQRDEAKPGECQGQEARDVQASVADRRRQLEDKLREHRDKVMAKENVELNQAELAAALKRNAHKILGNRYDDIAAMLLEDIRNHKDPDLDDGCIVIDASNDLWSYVENEGDSERGWHVFGETHVYPFSEPKRPIERVDVESVKSRATY